MLKKYRLFIFPKTFPYPNSHILVNPGAKGKIHLRGLQSAHKSVQM